MTTQCPLKILQRSLSARPTVVLSSAIYGDPKKDRAIPPIVLLHGLFGQKKNWDSVAKALQNKLRTIVYSMDLRNHGSSPRVDSMTYEDQAADIIQFIKTKKEEEGFDKVNLIGHSMGGKVAMRLAVDAEGGSLLNKLIIEDANPLGHTPTGTKMRSKMLDYTAAMKKIDRTQSRREIEKILKPAIPDAAIRRYLLTNLEKNPDGSLDWKCNMRAIEGYVTDSLGTSVISTGSFAGPTLLLVGEHSGCLSNIDKKKIRPFFPQIHFETISGAGHWVHADQPEAFIEAVVKFLIQE